MNLNLAELGQRWAAMSARERGLLLAGLACVSFALAYEFVYVPLQQESKRVQQQIDAERLLRQHLSEIGRRAAALQQQAGNQTSVVADPLQLLEDSSVQMEVGAGMRIRADGPDRFNVAVDKLAFDKLIYWLAALQQQHGVQVAELNLHRLSADSADVAGKLTLQALVSGR